MEMTKCFFNIQTVLYFEIIMDKRIRNINELQKDNFPKSIKFLDENKKAILKLEFNELGFMVKAIDKAEKIIFEDSKIMTKEIIRRKI